jgi:very-long-chain (3R)-3-hydroxyacyl-CoA dehydratase
MEDPAYPNSRRSQPLLTRKKYFLAYNGVCLALWAIITLRAILLVPILLVHDHLYGLREALHPLLTFTQSLAVLEVLHSLVGIVRASPLTTAMQVASRLLLVWGVVSAFPEIVVRSQLFGTRMQHSAGEKGGSYAYAGMLLAWGITECIRYGFFVWKEGLGEGRVPRWLTWLRYILRKVVVFAPLDAG